MNLTRKEALSYPECYELDELIAREVMEWHPVLMSHHEAVERYEWFESNGRYTGYVVGVGAEYPRSSFRPSIDITDAWEVVEKIKQGRQGDPDRFFLRWVDDHWTTGFTNPHLQEKYWKVLVQAETAPLAICRLALLLELTSV